MRIISTATECVCDVGSQVRACGRAQVIVLVLVRARVRVLARALCARERVCVCIYTC